MEALIPYEYQKYIQPSNTCDRVIRYVGEFIDAQNIATSEIRNSAIAESVDNLMEDMNLDQFIASYEQLLAVADPLDQ
jgi:hypothetical protein